MKIITNNQPRPVITGYELSEKEKQDFDYFTEDELNESLFFRYKKQVYFLGDFMRIPKNAGLPVSNYDGVAGQSYFDGILIKLSNCGDAVTVAHYYE